MEPAEQAWPRTRKDCKYNAGELEQIFPFKEAFITAATSTERVKIFRTDILPAMFNHWKEGGKVPRDTEEAKMWVKELGIWCSNNWRMKGGLARQSNKFKPTRAQVLWKNRREEILGEIGRLAGLDNVTTNTTEAFALRTRATKNILKRMTVEERVEVDKELAKLQESGYSEDVKSRRAVKFHEKRVKETMDVQFKEMGMTSVVFVTFKYPDGRLFINVYDRIAELMGVNTRSFMECNKDLVDKMKLKLMSFMQNNIEAQSTLPVPNGIGNGNQEGLLTTTSRNFPVLPESTVFSTLSKKQWEKLYKDYMGQHYSLATNGKTVHLPYGNIAERQSLFIENKYLPKNFQIRDARNLTKENMVDLFTHLRVRQQKYGPEEAFRFKSIRKGSSIIRAHYPSSDEDDAGQRQPGPRNVTPAATVRIRRKPKKARATFLDSDVVIPPYPDGTPDPERQDDTPADDLGSHQGQPDASSQSEEVRNHSDAGPSPSSITGHSSPAVVPYVGPVFTDDTVYVNESMMTALHHFGIPTPLPVNGPSDGSPCYPVARSLYEACLQTFDVHDATELIPPPPTENRIVPPQQTPTPTPVAAPRPRPKPRPKQKSKPASGIIATDGPAQNLRRRVVISPVQVPNKSKASRRGKIATSKAK